MSRLDPNLALNIHQDYAFYHSRSHHDDTLDGIVVERNERGASDRRQSPKVGPQLAEPESLALPVGDRRPPRLRSAERVRWPTEYDQKAQEDRRLKADHDSGRSYEQD